RDRPGAASASLLYELDPVAVRVLGERDHGAAVLHGTGLTHDLATKGADALAGPVDVVGADRDVAESIAEIVVLRVPVVRELDDGRRRLVAVADEREREAARLVVAPAQELHAEHAGVERERLLEIVHPDHGVEHAHCANLPSMTTRTHKEVETKKAAR